jgi:hypothetical protein
MTSWKNFLRKLNRAQCATILFRIEFCIEWYIRFWKNRCGQIWRLIWFIFLRPQNRRLYIVLITCSGQNQKANILEISTDSQGRLVLSSKAGPLKSLISVRSRGHKVGVVFMTYEMSLYHWTQPKLILSVPVCRIYTVKYTYKISELKPLLLKNSERHNIWVPHWSWSFLTWGYLCCILNISTRERFEKLKFLAFP